MRLSGDGLAEILVRLELPTSATNASVEDVSVPVKSPIESVDARLMHWPLRSYTGQPSAEIHTYGSLPILQAIVDACVSAGARPARPGEFTMRAFLAGRLDLTQAEAVLGVIDAETRGSLDHALRQLAGNLSRPLEQSRDEMLNLLADIEAGLDFVDEDIEFVSDSAVLDRLSSVRAQLIETRETFGERVGHREAVVIVIRGEPNAGKSQLLNRITGSQVAIVADRAGTTRDVVTVESEIVGIAVRFVDTAGIEFVDDQSAHAEVSKQSQMQAQRTDAEAAIRICCVDASRADFHTAAKWLRHNIGEKRQSTIDLWVATKVDLATEAFQIPEGWIASSSVAQPGVDSLMEEIATALVSRDRIETGSVVGTAARCRSSLENAITSVTRAITLTESQQGHEFVASELRMSIESLGEVTGAVYTDDILDRVFSRFCIGK